MSPHAAKKRIATPGLEIILPATSANLGPAFDAAAVALGIFLEVTARPAEEFSIVANGRDAAICGELENHLILTTYREVLREEGKAAPPLALHIENEIPIGKGCGSSAAARLAGVALAVHFGKLHWTYERIIAEAARREGHPDNAAACWMGGLAVARLSGEDDVQVARITPRGRWPILLAVPQASLSTTEARRVLPEQYSRADVVTNIQNSMLLLSAFIEGMPELLSSALEDRIHQPYRAALCPLLPALQELSGRSGILGVALSGAGPSVLVLLSRDANGKQAAARIHEHLQARGLRAELLPTAISPRGVRQRILREG